MMRRLGLMVLATWVVACQVDEPEMRCNGAANLCDRRLDEVAFAATHNGMSSMADDWWGANQEFGLQRQLEDGVRGFLLDTYHWEGAIHLCHGFCELGHTLLRDGLVQIRDFMVKHPNEVVILLFEDYVSASDTADVFADVGLDQLAYTHVDGASLPTLRQMIEQDTRLLVTAQGGGAPPSWYHNAWTVFFDTPFDFKAPSQFSCALNRGTTTNPLFLLNHWLGDTFGLPSQERAVTANSFDVLHERALACWTQTGHIPNLVAVDFFDTGDVFAVVEALNNLNGQSP
jgi:hypothetical protein